MMRIIDDSRYLEILQRICREFPYWEELEGKTIFLSGAAGMIGSLLTDAVMTRNQGLPPQKRSTVLAVGRNEKTAKERFPRWWGSDHFYFIAQDITQPIGDLPVSPDYLIHGASTTHPIAYSTQPINTILSNIFGTHYMLELAAKHPQSRFLLLSSVEIYGENRGDTEYFTEDYCGHIDCNTLRAGYPEGKRASEALCQAYIREKAVNAVILRLPRCYGPTMRTSDSKAIAQFIKKGVFGEDIVLKSKGEQRYSYAHTADAVMGILYSILEGENGQAYNLGDDRSDKTLYELAESIAEYVGTKVVFDIPDAEEQKGYSTATKALMDGRKLKDLGWRAHYGIKEGIRETIDILRELTKNEIP